MSSNIDVTLRSYQPGDDEAIVDLLKIGFPKWNDFENPLDMWRWKYRETPLKCIIVVAVVKEKIVGCLHKMIYLAKIGSETTTLQYGNDLAVHPEYRGNRIWRKMDGYQNKLYPKLTKYSFSTTTSPIVLKSFIERGRSLLPIPITRMIKTKDIDRLIKKRPIKNKFLTKFGYFGIRYLNNIQNIFRRTIKPISNFDIVRVSEFEANIDAFYELIKNDYNIIVEKKRDYLNWRFKDNERGNYVKFQAVDEGKTIGYIVVGYKHGDSEGQIEDLLALKDRLDVVDSLVQKGCSFLDEMGMNSIFYQVALGHPYQEFIRRHGFVDSRSRPTVEFDYSISWKEGLANKDIPFLKETTPEQVHFNYANTI